MDEVIEKFRQKDSSFEQKIHEEEIKYKDWSQKYHNSLLGLKMGLKINL